MANSNTSIVKRDLVKDLRLTETILLLAGSVMLQFIIHLVAPVNGVPLGKVLLPAFIAPLIAILFFRFHVAMIAAIAAPFLNYLLTGAPKPEILATLTLETAIFTAVCFVLINYTNLKNFSALISIVIAVLTSFILIPLIDESALRNSDFYQSFVTIIPGIVLLSVLNILLLRYKGK